MPVEAGEPLTGAWGQDGSITLSDGRHLVPEGIALPTPLSAEPAALRAAEAAAGAVLDGRFIIPSATRPDRHGRLAAIAALITPATGSPEPEDLATALLRAGSGTARPVAGDGPCRAARLAAEAQAQRETQGIWSHPGIRPSASDEAALAIRAGLFTVTEGRVRDVGVTRDRVFLNFGARWRQDFTVMIATEDFATILGDSLEPAMLRGTLIRVRGVVHEDGGPAITVRRQGEITLLAPATSARTAAGEAASWNMDRPR
ncbi:hypothetical protein ACI7BZ_05940 [Xanthobacter sp. AM11]|uniref:hypothetical protein n=1 Tax=Xanthobacter sp. AM11 TaxID=3380643 RepID=UPI0039BF8351